MDARGDYDSPVKGFMDILEMLSWDKWIISKVGQTDNETVYTLANNAPHTYFYNVDVLPDKEFFPREVRRYWRSGLHHHIYRFNKFKWFSDVGVFFPSEIVIEKNMNVGKEEHKISRKTFYLENIELNRDYDDGILKADFEAGTSITDLRVDPPMTSKYSYPESLDGYLEDFSEKVEALKDQASAGTRS